MPPKHKSKSKAVRRRTKSVKRKTKTKSTFRNKKLKKSLPSIPRLSAQERAHGLSRIQRGEYQEGIHQPYVRSGKDIIVNPAYLNSAAYLSGNVPINAEVDIDDMRDEQGVARPGYEPEPLSDSKRTKPEAIV
jgi:hypothetical protein